AAVHSALAGADAPFQLGRVVRRSDALLAELVARDPQGEDDYERSIAPTSVALTRALLEKTGWQEVRWRFLATLRSASGELRTATVGIVSMPRSIFQRIVFATLTTEEVSRLSSVRTPRYPGWTFASRPGQSGDATVGTAAAPPPSADDDSSSASLRPPFDRR